MSSTRSSRRRDAVRRRRPRGRQAGASSRAPATSRAGIDHDGPRPGGPPHRRRPRRRRRPHRPGRPSRSRHDGCAAPDERRAARPPARPPPLRRREDVCRRRRGRAGRRVLARLEGGVDLEDGPTAPAEVRQLGPSRLELVLHEGRNRQVRRMLEAVGHPVVRLRRSRYAGLGPGGCGPGSGAS